MIEKFDLKEKDIAKSISTLSLDKNDILVIQVDQDKFDLDDVNKLFDVYSRVISNQMIVTFDGIEFKVIKKNY